jgi:hypothetical protein
MRERPILFSGAMVRAILDGTKTQTRRVVKQRDIDVEDGAAFFPCYVTGEPESIPVPCPFGQPGDRLWVRETWQFADWTEEGEPYIRYQADKAKIGYFGNDVPDGEALVETWETLSRTENYAIDNKAADRRWRPSIHMPRWASRITLEVTGVRVERLQDITQADAEAEGIAFMREIPDVDEKLTATQLYAALWNSINEKRGLGWDANPWVWVVEFRRVGEPCR